MTERRQFVGHSSTAEAAQFTGRSREITVDMQAETLRVHDGITPGGYPLMRADMANMDSTVINGKLSVFERLANKVTTITQYVTNSAYPTALAVWKLCLTKANLALDNLSDAGKAVIKALANEVIDSRGDAVAVAGFPNYNTREDMTSQLKSGKAMEESGWISFKYGERSWNQGWIKVNGFIVAGQDENSGPDWGQLTDQVMIPVSAGDFVQIGSDPAGINRAYFYKLKGL